MFLPNSGTIDHRVLFDIFMSFTYFIEFVGNAERTILVISSNVSSGIERKTTVSLFLGNQNYMKIVIAMSLLNCVDKLLTVC